MRKTNGHKNGNGNGHKPTPQRAKLDRIEAKAKAVEMFLNDCSMGEIARTLGVSVRTIYRYVEAQYEERLARDKQYFDRRVALMFDKKLEAVTVMTELLGDEKFLQTADPDRIEAIQEAIDTVTDRAFSLMSAVARHLAEKQQQERLRPAPVVEIDGAAE